MGADLFCGSPKFVQRSAIAQIDSAIGSPAGVPLAGGSSSREFDDHF